jgi:hypothetical protein
MTRGGPNHHQTARDPSENVGVAYVAFAVEHPVLFRRMLAHGTGANDGCRAEVLAWWSVVHGLALLAMDGHLGGVDDSPEHLERVVRSVLRSL